MAGEKKNITAKQPDDISIIKKQKKPVVKASVRDLVEFATTSGSIYYGLPATQKMLEGMRGHRARQSSAGADYLPEQPLTLDVEGEQVIMRLGGRIDGLFPRGGMMVIEEIKITDLPPGAIESEGYEVHWAQAMCYGHMLCSRDDLDMVCIRLMYATADGASTAAFERIRTREQLAEAFYGWTEKYLKFLDALENWRQQRQASLAKLKFPYGAFRKGQRKLSANVYTAIKHRKRLFAQAPTGTGKTAAVLFPAIKTMAAELTNHIFYLTARTTTRAAAEDALEHMRAQGLRLRSITIIAKKKICHMQTEFCSPDICPRAAGHFDRLHAGIYAALERDRLTRQDIEELADKHMLCPFEFTLSLVPICDVIICDYNYVFDPFVRLKKQFMERGDMTLLIDEAHNLNERAREMLSAQLKYETFHDFRRLAGKEYGRKTLYKSLTRVLRALEAQAAETDGDMDISEEAPDELKAAVQSFYDAAGSLMQVENAATRRLVELYFVALRWMMAYDRFDDHYRLLRTKLRTSCDADILCLDAREYLEEMTRKLKGVILFSATLSPLAYYRDLLGGGEQDALLSMDSPFEKDNLLVARVMLDTRYRARNRTASRVAEIILAMITARRGNYMVFFPSYAYLHQIAQAVNDIIPDIAIDIQQEYMDEGARNEFIENFVPGGDRLAFAVLGGAFGEGIDLPGERLNGVAVVGVGLPQICVERDALRDYFASRCGMGYEYSYVYPGMNKVMQAVGRVIRTESDIGVAVLIDNRYMREPYLSLMPDSWLPSPVVATSGELEYILRKFWKE